MDNDRDSELMITVPLDVFRRLIKDATRFEALQYGLLASALLDPSSDADLYIEREPFQVLLKALCPISYATQARLLKEQKEELIREWQEETQCE